MLGRIVSYGPFIRRSECDLSVGGDEGGVERGGWRWSD